jgi:hypothetical protein
LDRLFQKDGFLFNNHRPVHSDLGPDYYLNIAVFGDGTTQSNKAVKFNEKVHAYYHSYRTIAGHMDEEPFLPTPFGTGD